MQPNQARGLTNESIHLVRRETLDEILSELSIPFYTPTSSSDTYGKVTSIVCDDSYIYVKTSTGWKRSSLSSW